MLFLLLPYPIKNPISLALSASDQSGLVTTTSGKRETMGGMEARFCGMRRWVRSLASFPVSDLMGRFKRTNKAAGSPLSESKHTHKTIFSSQFKIIMEEIRNKNMKYLRKMKSYWNLGERDYKSLHRVWNDAWIHENLLWFLSKKTKY